MDTHGPTRHQPVRVLTDAHGVVYTFPSIHAGWVVRVAVPSDIYMYNAVTTALLAANNGVRLWGQVRVDRVRGER